MAQCSVEGCEQPVVARDWCRKHYSRWHRHGDPQADHRKHRGVCSVEGCNKQHHSHGLCRAHWYLWNRHGDPLIKGKPTGRPRQAIVGYEGAHYRVQAERGSASDHHCAECGATAAQWAYDYSDPAPLYGGRWNSPYSLDISRYSPMCVACHARYDAERR